MSTNTIGNIAIENMAIENVAIENVALAEFQNASNAASDLAERIARCGRAGASKTETITLLKAWQFARNEARSSHERLLTKERANFRA